MLSIVNTNAQHSEHSRWGDKTTQKLLPTALKHHSEEDNVESITPTPFLRPKIHAGYLAYAISQDAPSRSPSTGDLPQRDRWYLPRYSLRQPISEHQSAVHRKSTGGRPERRATVHSIIQPTIEFAEGFLFQKQESNHRPISFIFNFLRNDTPNETRIQN